MSAAVDPVAFGALVADVRALRESEEDLKAKIEALEAQDKNRMRWAIGALGAAVIALGSYIWAFKVDGK
jgi:hypothetical protein